MGNSVFAYKPASDSATLTGGAAAATMPLSNAKTMNLDENVRFTNLADTYFVIDLGAATAITLVYLGGHNGTLAGTIRVRAADTEANLTAAPGVDQSGLSMISGSAVTDLHFFRLLFAAAQTYRWWRIDIDDATNTLGYIDVGRLYVVNAWQLSDNISFGGGLGFNDGSHVQWSPTGQAFIDIATPRRTVRERLEFQSEEQMYTELYELHRQVGLSSDILFLRNPDATTHLQRRSFYGKLKAIHEIVNHDVRIYSAVIEIEELMS